MFNRKLIWINFWVSRRNFRIAVKMAFGNRPINNIFYHKKQHFENLPPQFERPDKWRLHLGEHCVFCVCINSNQTRNSKP